MGGRLEREIRSVPDVVACSVTDEGLVVLVSPSGNAQSVEREAIQILQAHGSPLGLSVVGGSELVAATTGRPGRARMLLVGAVAATAIIAASSLLSGLRGDRPPQPPRPATASGPGASRLPSAPRGATGPLSEPAGTATGATRAPVTASGLHAAAHEPRARLLGLPAPPETEPETATAPGTGSGVPVGAREPGRSGEVAPTRRARTPGGPECSGPGVRGAPRSLGGVHAGNGPRAWSRSVLVEPHDLCSHGPP